MRDEGWYWVKMKDYSASFRLDWEPAYFTRKGVWELGNVLNPLNDLDLKEICEVKLNPPNVLTP